MSSIEKTKKWEDEDCYEIKENRPPPPEVTMKKSRIDRIRTGRYADDGQRQTHTHKKKQKRIDIQSKRQKQKTALPTTAAVLPKKNTSSTKLSRRPTANQRRRNAIAIPYLKQQKKNKKKKQKTIARLVGGNVLDPSGIRSLSRKFKVTKKNTQKKTR